MGIFLVRGRLIGLFLDWVECCSWLNESMIGGVLEPDIRLAIRPVDLNRITWSSS